MHKIGNGSFRSSAVAGVAIGIVVIDISYPLVPGNVANATTYGFPVIHRVLRGVSVERILSGDPTLSEAIIEVAKDLAANNGVRAIVGACGSFANYQKEVSAALDVPVFMSVMLQVPLILSSLRPGQKLGIIAASETALTSRVFEQCGITDSARLVVAGARSLPEFQCILQNRRGFNSRKLEHEVVSLAKGMLNTSAEIGAFLVQCSDLPPYAYAIQQATGVPVFDMNGLIEWVYHAVVRKRYAGFI